MKIKNIAFYVLLANLLMTSVAFASDAGSVNCKSENIRFLEKQLIVNSNKETSQYVYLLKNKSNEIVYINHPTARTGTAQAGWFSQIDAQKWSALAVNKPSFNLTCQNILQAGKQKYINCKDVLEVRQFNVKLKSKNAMGTFWLAENDSLNNILEKVKERGFVLNE